jgi:Protein of unknown function (DUF3990)
MPVWNNGPLILYHGCSNYSLEPLNRRGIRINSVNTNIDISVCRKRSDFGQGFYTTTSEHQARQWANQQVRRARVRPGSNDIATVLRLEVDRTRVGAFATLVFVGDMGEYWNFVAYCRHGFPPHAPQVQGMAQRIYDVVYGPVSMWPQGLP